MGQLARLTNSRVAPLTFTSADGYHVPVLACAKRDPRPGSHIGSSAFCCVRIGNVEMASAVFEDPLVDGSSPSWPTVPRGNALTLPRRRSQSAGLGTAPASKKSALGNECTVALAMPCRLNSTWSDVAMLDHRWCDLGLGETKAFGEKMPTLAPSSISRADVKRNASMPAPLMSRPNCCEET